MVWIEALNIPLRDEEVLQVPIQIKCRCSGCGKHFVKCIFCDHPISGKRHDRASYTDSVIRHS